MGEKVRLSSITSKEEAMDPESWFDERIFTVAEARFLLKIFSAPTTKISAPLFFQEKSWFKMLPLFLIFY